EWLNTSTGFNSLDNPSWMLGAKVVQENEAVQTGIINRTSFMSSETWYGYAAASAFPCVDAGLYARISDTDFRKLSFVAPAGSALSGQEPYVNQDFVGAIPPYASLKFRPGFGNPDDFTVGSSTAIPVMRVEEMWLIEAEAAAHQSYQRGKDLIEDFMAYRDENYACQASTQDELVDEIVLQKRIELWGEGQSYFDFKRLDMSVIRGYQGTNAPPSA
ncbi:MAG: RagB/SusD family nutrient uptake outer membrane protein, partial [Muribaculaceae bacterium]|nr:RagB/SusD family nutrient uptake outer membrane protein [Muribaculaceae bacterium]